MWGEEGALLGGLRVFGRFTWFSFSMMCVCGVDEGIWEEVDVGIWEGVEGFDASIGEREEGTEADIGECKTTGIGACLEGDVLRGGEKVDLDWEGDEGNTRSKRGRRKTWRS